MHPECDLKCCLSRRLTRFWSTAHVFVHLSESRVRYWVSHSGVWDEPMRCGGSCWGVRLEELSEHSPFAFKFWALRTETCHPRKSCAAEVAFSACLTPLIRPGNLRRLCQNREFVSSSYLRLDAERSRKTEAWFSLRSLLLM